MEINKIVEWILKGIATLGCVLFVFYMFKDTKNSAQEIKQYTKTKDSLEALVQKYQYDYSFLKKRADELDSLIKTKKENVRIVKEKFYMYRDRKITNPDSATKYIINFLKD
jgi:hypothetical protein